MKLIQLTSLVFTYKVHQTIIGTENRTRKIPRMFCGKLQIQHIVNYLIYGYLPFYIFSAIQTSDNINQRWFVISFIFFMILLMQRLKRLLIECINGEPSHHELSKFIQYGKQSETVTGSISFLTVFLKFFHRQQRNMFGNFGEY